MFTRLLCLFLYCGLLVQTTEATPSFVVIAQYVPKILSLSVKIVVTTGNGTKEILSTQSEIKSLVSSAETSIHTQLTILERYVEESKEKANQTGKNITSCIETEKEDINSINLQVLEECRLEDAVKHLYVYALKLAKEELALQVRTQWCIIKYPTDGDELKKCFDEKIKDVEDKIEEFEMEMNVTIPEAKKHSSTCTKKYFDELNKAISKVSLNFEDCVYTPELRLK